MSDVAFDPMTAREALLAIKFVKLSQEDLTAPPDFELIQALADAGLDRTALVNFELSDQLADRLAEAHRVLGQMKEYLYGKMPDGDSQIEGLINEALALPPDLEAMVERRGVR